jgi:hypothetical protein
MTELILKPAQLSLCFAEDGIKTPLDEPKVLIGWEAEAPLADNFNFYENKRDKAIAHINQRGICEWDAATEYEQFRSYVTDSSGRLMCAKLDSTNKNPMTEPTYWGVVFDPATM